ncbi:MAG: hypothetical protein GXO22_02920 [Aquificae bacterium]|nr:hypothetical protein [Aquificota bacterium]
MKFDRKTRHDIDAVFSKLETSIQLLKTELSDQEKEAVLKIMDNSAKRLKTFCNALLTSFFDIDPQKKEINLAKYFGVNDKFLIIADPKIVEILINTIKNLNKSPDLKIKIINNKLKIEGNFYPNDNLEKFLLEFIKMYQN